MEKQDNTFKGSTVPEFLEWVHQSHPDDPYLNYLLKHGVFLTAEDIIEYPLEIILRENDCYGNSQLATFTTDDKLEYFEGYAVFSDKFFYPVNHAFNMFNDKVVDFTWKHGYQYYGVKIPLSFYEEKMLKTCRAIPLLRPFVDRRNESLDNFLTPNFTNLMAGE